MGTCASKGSETAVIVSKTKDDDEIDHADPNDSIHDDSYIESPIPSSRKRRSFNDMEASSSALPTPSQSRSSQPEQTSSSEFKKDPPPKCATSTECLTTTASIDLPPATQNLPSRQEDRTETSSVNSMTLRDVYPVKSNLKTKSDEVARQDDDLQKESKQNEGVPYVLSEICDRDFKRLCIRMQMMLDHDPWDKLKKYHDESVCLYIKQFPDICKVKYQFESVSGQVLPLSMLCSLGASVDAVRLAYNAYSEAIDECDVWVGTPLHYACSYKAKVELVEFLIIQHPDALWTANYFGRTPLHMACLFKAPASVVLLLLQQYPEAVSERDRDGYTPLHLACENSASPEVVDLLVSCDPESVEAITEYRSTPLHFACSRNAPKAVVQRLLDVNPDMAKYVDLLGQTPLHMAALGNASETIIRLLVEANPDGVKSLTDGGESPLRMARRKKAPDSVLTLLSCSAE